MPKLKEIFPVIVTLSLNLLLTQITFLDTVKLTDIKGQKLLRISPLRISFYRCLFFFFIKRLSDFFFNQHHLRS